MLLKGSRFPVETVFAEDADILLDTGKFLTKAGGRKDVRHVSEKKCCKGVLKGKIGENCFGQLAGEETTLLGGCTNFERSSVEIRRDCSGRGVVDKNCAQGHVQHFSGNMSR